MALSQEINQKILIAGSSGMVGSAIYRAFLKKEKEGQYKKTIFFTPTRKELDFSVYSQVEEWFKIYKPQVVIIAAAKVGGIYANKNYPTEFILENLKIQTNLIEVSKLYEVKKLLFLGSSCIYPKFAKQPIKEEYLLSGDLESTNESYAIAKIAGIKLCSALKKQYNFDSISLMPTNLYGPGDNYHSINSHVLPSLINKFYNAKQHGSSSVTCWGTGSPRRELLYVDDLAEAVIFALENISSDNKALFDKYSNYLGIINVGIGIDKPINELAKLIASEVNFQGEIIWDKSKPDGTPRKILNSSKINKLGWKATTHIEKGIALTLKDYIESKKNNTLRCI